MTESDREDWQAERWLLDPLRNKGTAFTDDERDRLGLHGLLPPHVATLDEQVARRLEHLRNLEQPVEQYAFLRELQDSNETLFYALLSRNLPELLPLVYTPTVGEGCQRFSHLFRRPRGLFLSPLHVDRLDELLAHPRFDDVSVIVVSDGERILGLGDQGAGGMGIPIGKLSLYTAGGGIHPGRTLPILLDTGTDNAELRDDPIYVGWRHERLRGDEYDAFVETFVDAVMRRWPHVLLQWEDFAGSNAMRLLERYRDRLCTFNDDIQGTAAIVVGTVLSAIAVSGQALADQRVAVVGAGSAGLGISNLLVDAMVDAGLDRDEACKRFYLIDRDGLLVEGGDLHDGQVRFARPRQEAGSLEETIGRAKPTILIGVTAHAGAFTEQAVRRMADGVDRPLVFPLSNPTSRSEATPADIMNWTDGRAIIGTGSPFAPVQVGGKAVAIDQINNAYVFPGMGLGILASRTTRVTDALFLVAAQALAELSPARTDPDRSLLPPLQTLRDVSRHIGIRVAERAVKDGLVGEPEGGIEAAVDALVWEPVYAEVT